MWQPVSFAPIGPWLRTKREGEDGENECYVRLETLDSEPEWIDRQGRTTVTHHSFLPPTHWRWIIEPKPIVFDDEATRNLK